MPRGQRAQQENVEKLAASKRPRRSADQKAQDDLEAARKRLVKANDAYEEAQAKAEEAKAEYERSVKIFDHASHHPDLPQADETPLQRNLQPDVQESVTGPRELADYDDDDDDQDQDEA